MGGFPLIRIKRAAPGKATAVIGRTGIPATSFHSHASSRAANCRAAKRKLGQTSRHKIEPYQSQHVPFALCGGAMPEFANPFATSSERAEAADYSQFAFLSQCVGPRVLWLRRAIRFDFYRRAEDQAAFVWGSQRCAIRKYGAASQSWGVWCSECAVTRSAWQQLNPRLVLRPLRKTRPTGRAAPSGL